MSFFSNFQSDRCPGQINGNPINGLNEKACIEAQKIFDACIKQSQFENLSVTLTDNVPENPTSPLTFVSAKSINSKGVISSLQVDRLPDKCNCARVQATVQIPIEVVYLDASGIEGKGNSTVSVPLDVILYIPSPSVISYNIDAVVSVIAPEGTYVSENVFNIDCCATVILRVSIPVELLIPTYGYCAIPPAQDYSQEVCAGFFELPLYPQSDCNDCSSRNN